MFSFPYDAVWLRLFARSRHLEASRKNRNKHLAAEQIMKIDGSCHCGGITFEAEVDPDQVLLCHCTDCQALSGSAYRSVAPVSGDSFRLLCGELTTYIKIAEDGTPRQQTFCPQCGTPVYAGPIDGQSGMLGLRVGAITQRDQLPPRQQYYCASAQPWVQDLSALPRR